ncbi:MAG TPA: Fur family transcriptional regulator [Candidatus Bathyarchaeia archaeon]|nr:Fur family transcriptional regulator [Candidatus Bathyarchaeia archaeon]
MKMAPAHDVSLLERMKSMGLRLTGQRRVLAELLDGAADHLDAEQVYQRARVKDPSIHRATVYRTLNRLKKLGLVDELDLMHISGERHYYEVRPRTLHIHLVCTACKGVDEPSESFWDELKRRVEQENGFRPEVVRIEMAGTCAPCQRKRSRPTVSA